ncbi:hypothetical protein [Mycolicibacterium insubricum]|uniref:hypothetical protein n=1 Tax=Mycolicibacterium insubricum TaxID=444597 RepID=UPI0027E23FD3|nr:hypothetical protein [Mycolicibacterium insubricum]MCV7080485.1 hypothetical protein [Mycolicibacterium insubricum]
MTGSRNEYVVGWIKRGPSGVIGHNKRDSGEVADLVLAISPPPTRVVRPPTVTPNWRPGSHSASRRW